MSKNTNKIRLIDREQTKNVKTLTDKLRKKERKRERKKKERKKQEIERKKYKERK